jgi:hypothetical protein
MPVPGYQEFMRPILETVSDGHATWAEIAMLAAITSRRVSATRIVDPLQRFIRQNLKYSPAAIRCGCFLLGAMAPTSSSDTSPSRNSR